MSNYLPLILQYLGDPQKPQYLLLLSLKEVILTRSSEFAAHIDQVCKKPSTTSTTPSATYSPHPNPCTVEIFSVSWLLTRSPAVLLSPYRDVWQVLPHLFSHAQSPEEGVRNMVSECLGTLSNLHPPRVIGALKDLADKGTEHGD